MHPRFFECLGAGGFLMANRCGDDSNISSLFESGVHYIDYDVDNLEDLARQYLDDEEGRRRIATAAVDVVLNFHTWDHRVAQIINDLKQL
jgi:spore maturation protein CgeB